MHIDGQLWSSMWLGFSTELPKSKLSQLQARPAKLRPLSSARSNCVDLGHWMRSINATWLELFERISRYTTSSPKIGPLQRTMASKVVAKAAGGVMSISQVSSFHQLPHSKGSKIKNIQLVSSSRRINQPSPALLSRRPACYPTN